MSVYVAPRYYAKVYESICAGVPYMNHGLSFVKDTAGTYVVGYNGKTSCGCDSTIDIVLTVYPSYSKRANWTDLDKESVCRGETYSKNGFNVPTYKFPANKHVHNDTLVFKSVNGCDSVVHLQLTINDSVVKRFSASVCLNYNNGVYKDHDFTIPLTSAGVFVYSHTNTGKNGCDSTTILTLTVGQTYSTIFNEEVCEGEHYQKHGFNTIVTANTTKLYHNYGPQRPNGCDSSVTVNLTVHPIYKHSINRYVCREAGVYNKDGFYVALPAGVSSFTHSDTLHTIYGCDSISTLHLTIYDGNDTNIVASVCEGRTIPRFLGFNNIPNVIYVPGVYKYKASFKTIHGCDSNVNLTLTVKPNYYDSLTVYIMKGDSVNYDGKFYGKGKYKIVYAHTASVCDSILTLTVKEYSRQDTTMYVRVCRNAQTFYEFKGKKLTQSCVDYDTTEIRVNGVLDGYRYTTLNLTFIDTASRPTAINGLMNIYRDTIATYTCDTVPYNVGAGVPAVDSYLWETSDTTWTVVTSYMNTARIKIPKPGSGYIYVSAHNECGYSSKASLKVYSKVAVEDADADNSNVTIFPNPTNADYSIRISGMEGTTQISIADLTGKVIFREQVEVSSMENTFRYSAESYAKGVYMLSIRNGNKTVVKKLVVQ